MIKRAYSVVPCAYSVVPCEYSVVTRMTCNTQKLYVYEIELPVKKVKALGKLVTTLIVSSAQQKIS